MKYFTPMNVNEWNKSFKWTKNYTTTRKHGTRQAFQNNPTRFHRKHALILYLKPSTVSRIFHENLNYHPYKLLMTQQLQSSNHAVRWKLSQHMLQAIEEKQLAVDNILFTNKAHFYLHGHVSNQNMRYWIKENLYVIELKNNLCTPQK